MIVVIGFIGTLWSFMSDTTDYAGPGPTQTTSATTAKPKPTTTQPPSKPTTPPAQTKVPAPDKNPSDLPAPRTYDEATTWMQKNPVYTKSVAIPTDCAVAPVNAQTASNAELEKHLNDLTACLWRVWSPPLAAVGYEMPRPPVTVYSSAINTACGKQDDLVNAAYCPVDQRMYYGKKLYLAVPSELRNAPFTADTVLAHEFGHAVQARTGILLAEHAWEGRGSTSKADADLFSRRTEAQADCFAGEFTASVAAANRLTDADLKNLRKIFYAIGDDVLRGDPDFIAGHGTGKSRQAWFTAGQTNNQLKTCNSFTVPASQVH